MNKGLRLSFTFSSIGLSFVKVRNKDLMNKGLKPILVEEAGELHFLR